MPGYCGWLFSVEGCRAAYPVELLVIPYLVISLLSMYGAIPSNSPPRSGL